MPEHGQAGAGGERDHAGIESRRRAGVTARLARGCLRWARRHAGNPRRDCLAELSELRGIEQAARGALDEVVDDARARGHTWTEIGRVLGMTRQSAYERFTDRDPSRPDPDLT